MQSPIDLVATPSISGDGLSINYHHLTKTTFRDGLGTLTVIPHPGGVMSFKGKLFDLLELHFHAPGDHTFDGRAFDLEAHFVHQAPDGTLAVLGLVYDEAPGRHPIDEFLEPIPDKDQSIELPDFRRIEHLIPRNARRYHYVGSRTTPPFLEGVEWTVVSEVQSVGRDALRAYTTRYAPNNRPTQPLNGRTVTLN